MNIIGFLIVGFLAGWLASVLMRGKGLGCLGNILVGALGALIGGLLFDALDIPVGNDFFWSLLVALVGAMVLLFIARLLRSVS